MAPYLKTLITEALPAFFVSEINQLPLKKLPKWLQKDIAAFAAKDATSLFEFVLQAVYKREYPHIKASQSKADVEMKAMAAGFCASGVMGADCDLAKFTTLINNMNMLPELIRMT